MTRRQQVAHRLWFGSAALARSIGDRAAGWVRKGPNKTHRIVRLLLLLLGAYLIARMIRAAPGVLWVIVPVWCWRAIRAQPPPVREQPEQEQPGPDLEAVREAWQGFVTTASEGYQGVHLRDLLTVLHRGGHHPTWEVADVRAMCQGLGIPVRQRVRVRGKGVTVGIHRDDFPAPLSPSPDPLLQEAAER